MFNMTAHADIDMQQQQQVIFQFCVYEQSFFCFVLLSNKHLISV